MKICKFFYNLLVIHKFTLVQTQYEILEKLLVPIPIEETFLLNHTKFPLVPTQLVPQSLKTTVAKGVMYFILLVTNFRLKSTAIKVSLSDLLIPKARHAAL